MAAWHRLQKGALISALQAVQGRCNGAATGEVKPGYRAHVHQARLPGQVSKTAIGPNLAVQQWTAKPAMQRKASQLGLRFQGT